MSLLLARVVYERIMLVVVVGKVVCTCPVNTYLPVLKCSIFILTFKARFRGPQISHKSLPKLWPATDEDPEVDRGGQVSEEDPARFHHRHSQGRVLHAVDGSDIIGLDAVDDKCFLGDVGDEEEEEGDVNQHRAPGLLDLVLSDLAITTSSCLLVTASYEANQTVIKLFYKTFEIGNQIRCVLIISFWGKMVQNLYPLSTDSQIALNVWVVRLEFCLPYFPDIRMKSKDTRMSSFNQSFNYFQSIFW